MLIAASEIETNMIPHAWHLNGRFMLVSGTIPGSGSDMFLGFIDVELNQIEIVHNLGETAIKGADWFVE